MDIFMQNPNITIFYRQIMVQKLFKLKAIFFLLNTEGSQTSINLLVLSSACYLKLI